MKHSRIVLVAMAVSLGLLLVLFCLVAGRSEPTMAAPRSNRAPGYSLQRVDLPAYQIQCTLASTTTDALGVDNGTLATAATLADYTGLALATGDLGDVETAGDDWFRLDNAEIGATYEIDAIPDWTTNYNLGIIVYDGSEDNPIITDTNTANHSGEVELVPDSNGPYFFKVFQISAQCTGRTYHLNYSIESPTTPTSTPTNTPPPDSDPYEPNNTRGAAYIFPVATSASAANANFVPSATDQDWFSFYVKSGRRYRVSTSDLSGVDTYVEVFNEDGNRVTYDNDSGGGFASRADWQASYDGYYYIKVKNMVDVSSGSDSYDLSIAEISVAATATPRPAAANPNADRCDKTELGNFDFDHACVMSSNVSEPLNFVPPPYGGTDNDYLKLWVKPGLLYKCGTSKLSSGVDPNMILYDHNRNTIGGNDDVEPGNFNSYLAYYATYEGWMYLLVGTGDRTPPNLSDSDYTLRCDMEIPGQVSATATPRPANTPVPGATSTPRPPAATSTPVPTPTPREELTIRPLTTPTPVPATTPVPRFIPVQLLIYYDGNDDRQPGAGEGIAGISAQAYEVSTNQLLAQGFTDERGNLEFTVSAQGPVRVSVPFFGFSQLVAGEGASVYLRVPPHPLSGETP